MTEKEIIQGQCKQALDDLQGSDLLSDAQKGALVIYATTVREAYLQDNFGEVVHLLPEEESRIVDKILPLGDAAPCFVKMIVHQLIERVTI